MSYMAFPSQITPNFQVTPARQAEVQGAIEAVVKGVPVDLVRLMVHYTSLMEVREAEDEDIYMLMARLEALNRYLVPEARAILDEAKLMVEKHEGNSLGELTTMERSYLPGYPLLRAVGTELNRELSLLVFYRNFTKDLLYQELRKPYHRFHLGTSIKFTEKAVEEVLKAAVPVINRYFLDKPSRRALTYL